MSELRGGAQWSEVLTPDLKSASLLRRRKLWHTALESMWEVPLLTLS